MQMHRSMFGRSFECLPRHRYEKGLGGSLSHLVSSFCQMVVVSYILRASIALMKCLYTKRRRRACHGWYNGCMSNTIKTRVNDDSVEDFIGRVENETRRKDGFKLLEMYTRLTGETPKMWGSSMVGFGQYHYKSERSAQEGDWPLAGFSPRKQSLTLYVMPGLVDYVDLLKDLGKHKTSKGCLYINKLADVDAAVLEKIIQRSYLDAKKTLLP